MKKVLPISIAALIFLAGLYAGYRVFKPTPQTTALHSEVILTALKSEGFLVTQSYVFNQLITIEKTSGSEWKDIFWGQTVTASGNIKVNSGVNLAELRPEDISIQDQQIFVLLPPLELHSVEIVGDILLQNKQGILKTIFDSDPGYNLAYTQLKEQAREAAEKEDVQQEAKENTRQEIIRLIHFIDPSRKILIDFKK